MSIDLEINLLGKLEVKLDGKSILDSISQKGLGILVYLATNNGKNIERDQLASIFWPDSSEEASRYNLRYNLWNLRKLLNKADEIILGDKTSCLVASESLKLDIEEFDNNIEESTFTLESLERARFLYRGDFLEKFFIKECLEFNDWIFFQKEEYQRKYYNMIIYLSDSYYENREYAKGIELLRELLIINPLDEKIYIKLIEFSLAMGDRVSAFKIYYKCSEILREELNISPSKETKEAYYKIQNYIEHDIGVVSKKSYDEGKIILGDKFEKEELEKLVIDVKTYKNSHSYHAMGLVLKNLLRAYERLTNKDFSAYYFMDLSILDTSALKYTGVENRFLNNKKLIDNKLYSSLLELLTYMSKFRNIELIIDDFNYIDDESFNMIVLMAKNINSLNLILELRYTRDSTKIEYMKNI